MYLNISIKIYFNYLIFQNHIWKFIKLFYTALMIASEYGYHKIAKSLKSNKDTCLTTNQMNYDT